MRLAHQPRRRAYAPKGVVNRSGRSQRGRPSRRSGGSRPQSFVAASAATNGARVGQNLMAAETRAAGIMGDASDAGTARPQQTAIPSFAGEEMSPAAPIGPDIARVDNPIIHTGELDTFSRLRIEVHSCNGSAGRRGADVPVSA